MKYCYCWNFCLKLMWLDERKFKKMWHFQASGWHSHVVITSGSNCLYYQHRHCWISLLCKLIPLFYSSRSITDNHFPLKSSTVILWNFKNFLESKSDGIKYIKNLSYIILSKINQKMNTNSQRYVVWKLTTWFPENINRKWHKTM